MQIFGNFRGEKWVGIEILVIFCEEMSAVIYKLVWFWQC